MLRAVHLEDVRCTGSAHGGCQARCLLFWKEAWLEREGNPVQETALTPPRCTEQDLLIHTGSNPADAVEAEPPRYACQSTLLARATQPLRWWDLRQYFEDYTSGNACLSRITAALFFFLYHQLVSSGIGIGSALRWVYDTVQGWRGLPPYPIRTGKIMRGAPTPSVKLGVQPGDLVRIKPYEQILATIDEDGNNRGMFFDAEMAPFCGGTYRVLGRINKIIDESSGQMRHMKNECIVLDGVVCKACYAKHRRLCPRSIYPYWREIWLERVENGHPGPPDVTVSINQAR
jgi:hypothetical protein